MRVAVDHGEHVLGGDLAGPTLGIAGFGMDVILTTNRRVPAALVDELGASAVLSLRLPLTAATRRFREQRNHNDEIEQVRRRALRT